MSKSEGATPWLRSADKLKLALTLSLGIAFGLAPIANSMHRTWAWIYAAAAAVVAPVFEVDIVTDRRTDRPDLREHVRAGLTQAFYAQLIGFSSGLIWVVAAWVALLFTDDGSDWGFWTWLVVMATGGVYLLRFTSYSVAVDLWPDEASTPSRFREPVRIAATKFLWLTSVLAVAAVVLWGFTQDPFDVFLFVAVFTITFFATPPERDVYEIEPYKEAVDRIATAFGTFDYEVIRSPSTGDETVDPLLAEVDLYTARDGAAWLVDVRLRGGEIDWTEATSIATAAQVLEDWMAEGEERQPLVPLMIIVDATASPHLRRLVPKLGLTVLEIHSDHIELTTPRRSTERMFPDDSKTSAVGGTADEGLVQVGLHLLAKSPEPV